MNNDLKKALDEIRMINKKANDDDLLWYGEILTDDCYEHRCVRIRTIAYNGRVYYHKMINGEVIEIKELK